MRRIDADAPPGSAHQHTLTLPFDLRQKSRLRARLDGGEEVALQLPRGRVLRGGDLLLASDGSVVLVRAAVEDVSTVTAEDGTSLARAAYHLGNRHVPVQVGAGFLRYQHDHVLDEMVRALGLRVRAEKAEFEPEGGAYGHSHGHGDVDEHSGSVHGNGHVLIDHAHAHADEHGHGHEHGHEHGHRHGHGHEH